MTIELEAISEHGESSDNTGDAPGESAGEQQATAERLDAELRGSMSAGDPPAEEDEPTGDEQSDKADKPDSDDDPSPTADDDDKKADRGGWRWKGLRQKEQQLAQQQAELQAGYQTLAQREAAAKEYQETAARIKQLAVSDPRAAAREFARLTGQPAEDLYQSWTAARLQGGTEDEHDKLSQVPPAVRQLLDEQAEQIRQLKEGHEKYTTAQQQQAAAAAHEADCSRVLQVATAADSENGHSLPYLTTMPQSYRESFVSQGVAMAIQLQQSDGVPRGHDWLAKRLDGVRQRELQDQLSALPVSALQALLPAGLKVVNSGGTSQDPVNPAGDAPGRSQGRKRGGKRGLGNRAGAQSSTGARPQQSRAELEQALDERLRASME